MSSNLLTTLGEYTHKLWSDRARAVAEKSGKPVFDLGKGTPDIPLSPMYLENLKNHLDDRDAHFYSGYVACPEFREAMSQWYHDQGHGAITSQEIAVVNGGKDAIMHLPFAFLNPGDRCLVPDPGYPPFAQGVTIAGGQPISY